MTLRAAGEAFTTIEAVRSADNCGCVNETTPTDAELTALIDQASDVLCILSGGRVYGRQTVTVRPERCGGCYDACPCCGLDGIPLWEPDPVVNWVKINGVALDTNTYKIHERRAGYRLVRTSVTDTPPASWPSWQALWKADTETDTFAINYTYGVHIEWLIESAAIELVCHFASIDNAKRNQLQKGTVSANYNNVSVSLEERVGRIRGNPDSVSIGQQMAEFIAVYGTGPRSVVWAPELTDGWSFTVVGS